MFRNFTVALPGLLLLACASGPPTEAADHVLVGSHWQLVGSDGRITLHFEPAGRISGSGGCNRYFGRYRMPVEGALQVDGIASTRRYCFGGISERETMFFGALEQVSRLHHDAERLELIHPDGVLEFRPGADR